jgi:hypothetical protein
MCHTPFSKPTFRESSVEQCHSLDHVVGVSSGAAGAVATQGAVDVAGEVVGKVGNLKGALHAVLWGRRCTVGKEGRDRLPMVHSDGMSSLSIFDIQFLAASS